MKKFLSNRWVEFGFVAFVAIWAFLSVYSPDASLISFVSNYAIHVMFGFLGLGLFFLIYNQNKLMLVSLACCASLCIFLKNASNTRLVLPEDNLHPELSVAHINLSNIDSLGTLISVIKKYDPDILSLQEYTPDWDIIVSEEILPRFSGIKKMVRIDPYGMAVLSKNEFISQDTFYHKNVPNLSTTIAHGDHSIHIISSYLLSLNSSKRTKSATKSHFSTISRYINKSQTPVINLGEFNMVYWRNEITEFRKKAKLENSRRDYIGFRIPSDHIFYSEELQCTKFKELENAKSEHIGIMGIYQLKKARSAYESRVEVGLIEQ